MDATLLLSIAALVLTVVAIPASHHYSKWANRKSELTAKTRADWHRVGKRSRSSPHLFVAFYSIQAYQDIVRYIFFSMLIIFNLTSAAYNLLLASLTDDHDLSAFYAVAHFVAIAYCMVEFWRVGQVTQALAAGFYDSSDENQPKETQGQAFPETQSKTTGEQNA